MLYKLTWKSINNVRVLLFPQAMNDMGRYFWSYELFMHIYFRWHFNYLGLRWRDHIKSPIMLPLISITSKLKTEDLGMLSFSEGHIGIMFSISSREIITCTLLNAHIYQTGLQFTAIMSGKSNQWGGYKFCRSQTDGYCLCMIVKH